MEYICKVEPSPSDDRDWNVANTNLNVTITDGIDYRQIYSIYETREGCSRSLENDASKCKNPERKLR